MRSITVFALLVLGVSAVLAASPAPSPPPNGSNGSPSPAAGSPTPKPSTSPSTNGTSPTPTASPSTNGTNTTSPSPAVSPAVSPVQSPSPAPSFPCPANTTVSFYVKRPDTFVIIDVPECKGFSWYLNDKNGNVILEKYHGTYKEKDSVAFNLKGANPADARFYETAEDAVAGIAAAKTLIADAKNFKLSNTSVLTLNDGKTVVAYHTGVANTNGTVTTIQAVAKKAVDWSVAPISNIPESPSPSPSSPPTGLKKEIDLKMWELIAGGVGAFLVGIIIASCMCRTCCRPKNHSDESRHLLGHA